MGLLDKCRELVKSETEYDEFCHVLEDLAPIFTRIAVSEYQEYFSKKFNTQASQDEVKEIMHYFFEEYMFEHIFDK